MREFMRQRRRERNEGIELPPAVKLEKRASSPSEVPPRPPKSRTSRDKALDKSPSMSATRKGSTSRARTTSPDARLSTMLQGPAFPSALAIAERKGIVKMQSRLESIYESPTEEKMGLLRRESLGRIPPRNQSRSPRPDRDSGSSLWPSVEGQLQQPEPVILDEEDLPLVEHCESLRALSRYYSVN